MEKFKYTFVQDKCCVEEHEDEYLVLDIGDNCENLARYFKTLMSHKHDLERAEACLDQMFFQDCSSLIDDSLINTAIQLLVKCFSNPSGKGRTNLDSCKVFRIFAKKIGEKDLTELFSDFYNARNKTISHDEKGFIDNAIGITVDIVSGKAVDITAITVRKVFLFKENQQNLKKLIFVAKKYVDFQCDCVGNKMLEWYNNSGRIDLPTLDCSGFVRTNIW